MRRLKKETPTDLKRDYEEIKQKIGLFAVGLLILFEADYSSSKMLVGVGTSNSNFKGTHFTVLGLEPLHPASLDANLGEKSLISDYYFSKKIW